MINGNINQFLDTGWYNEATLFYQGYIYWCESDTDFSNDITRFQVSRWNAQMGDDMLYHSILDKNGEPSHYEKVLDISDKDMDKLKKDFLQAPIFDGKTFWQAENKIAWLDEGTPIHK